MTSDFLAMWPAVQVPVDGCRTSGAVGVLLDCVG